MHYFRGIFHNPEMNVFQTRGAVRIRISLFAAVIKGRIQYAVTCTAFVLGLLLRSFSAARLLLRETSGAHPILVAKGYYTGFRAMRNGAVVNDDSNGTFLENCRCTINVRHLV